MAQFVQVRACSKRLDRVSVVGHTLSPENAKRVEELLVEYVPWIKDAQAHLHTPNNFTFTLKPEAHFLSATVAEQLSMFEELIRKLLHYLGRSLANTSLSLGTTTA